MPLGKAFGMTHRLAFSQLSRTWRRRRRSEVLYALAIMCNVDSRRRYVNHANCDPVMVHQGGVLAGVGAGVG